MKKLLFIFAFLAANFYGFAQDTIRIAQDGADINLDKPKEFSDFTFRERLHFGGGISGLSFGNPTSIGISPMAGYDLTPDLTLGLGFTYQYYGFKFNGIKSSSNLIGKRIFVRNYVHFLDNLIGPSFLVGQIENFSDIKTNSPTNYSNPILIGLGIGQRRGLNLQVLYDLNYGKNVFKASPYGSALVFQVSGFLW